MNPVARVVSTVALAATAFFTLTAFQTLPDDAQLAIHWNVDGVADGFAGREALLLLPIIFGITALLIALAIRFDPKRANIVRSAEAVRDRIREMIENEGPREILSDDRIVALLTADGVNIARRTVAKYREAIGLGSSAERRRAKKLASVS